jgi:methylmalonyl-CoA/ethylmalonyl-CoA epimerase
VEDIQQAVRTLEARNVAFEEPAHVVAKMPTYDLWMASFRDPDRNLLALMDEKKRA